MIQTTTGLLARAGAVLALTVVLGGCASATGTISPQATAPTAAPASVAPTTAASAEASVAPSAEPSTAGGGGATGTAVTIKEFSFDPATLTAKVGQEVTWTNSGGVAHTVTFDTGGVDSGNLSPGSTFKHTFAAAGTFTYHCNIHAAMQATLTVTQ